MAVHIISHLPSNNIRTASLPSEETSVEEDRDSSSHWPSLHWRNHSVGFCSWVGPHREHGEIEQKLVTWLLREGETLDGETWLSPPPPPLLPTLKSLFHPLRRGFVEKYQELEHMRVCYEFPNNLTLSSFIVLWWLYFPGSDFNNNSYHLSTTYYEKWGCSKQLSILTHSILKTTFRRETVIIASL